MRGCHRYEVTVVVGDGDHLLVCPSLCLCVCVCVQCRDGTVSRGCETHQSNKDQGPPKNWQPIEPKDEVGSAKVSTSSQYTIPEWNADNNQRLTFEKRQKESLHWTSLGEKALFDSWLSFVVVMIMLPSSSFAAALAHKNEICMTLPPKPSGLSTSQLVYQSMDPQWVAPPTGANAVKAAMIPVTTHPIKRHIALPRP